MNSSGSPLSENSQKVDEGSGGGPTPLDRRLLMNSFICNRNFFFFFTKRLVACMHAFCTLGWFHTSSDVSGGQFSTD